MTRPVQGRTIAVDPSVIPLGSDVWIEGIGFLVAEDVGGLVKGRAIDIYFDDIEDAWDWGRKELIVIHELPVLSED